MIYHRLRFWLAYNEEDTANHASWSSDEVEVLSRQKRGDNEGKGLYTKQNKLDMTIDEWSSLPHEETDVDFIDTSPPNFVRVERSNQREACIWKHHHDAQTEHDLVHH